ncbi:MAG: cytochrome c3 family protein [Deltaproteobacteria bacterium]|nr:cytochrome c3 family protein [Deltaproteobacteria bacterium]
MKKNTFIIIAAFISLLLIGKLVSSQWESYHDFEGKCLDCHLTVPQPGETPRAFKKDISFMCYECHSSQKELSHPVDINPSMQVPASFPLNWKGDLTCISCHPAHNPGKGAYHLRSSAGGQGFCMLCHNDLENDLHKVSMGTAHVVTSTSSKFVAWELGNVLDELSIKCLSCHDAVSASDTRVDNVVFHDANQIGVSHPIGVSYLEAKRKYKGAYRRVEELPSQIKLFGGGVGCGSCHNPYSKQHFDLVISNEGSALCLACHVK